MGRRFRQQYGTPVLPVGYSTLPAVERREMLSAFIKETNEVVHGQIIGSMVKELIVNKMALNAERDYYWKKQKDNGLYLPEEDEED